MKKTTTWIGALAFAMTGFAPIALSQPTHSEPASLLIYPFYDARPGFGTIITVTNTNKSRVRCCNGQMRGSVEVQFTYINGVTCRETNLLEFLTPGDTLTVFADVHNPAQDRGWLWIEAIDPQTGQPIDFDFLVGSAIIVNVGTDFLDAYTPYSFQALTAGPDNDGSDRSTTDVNADGRADFDGIEYEFFPESLLLDRFFEERGPFQNELILMTPKNVGNNDPNDPANAACGTFLWFNNRENVTREGGRDCNGPFSRSFCFNCFTRGPLGTFVAGVRNLQGDPNELRRNGLSIQTGWFRIASDDPLLGIYLDHILTNGRRFDGGRELEYTGALGDDLGETPASLPHAL
jgi:hypothetical protein